MTSLQLHECALIIDAKVWSRMSQCTHPCVSYLSNFISLYLNAWMSSESNKNLLLPNCRFSDTSLSPLTASLTGSWKFSVHTPTWDSFRCYSHIVHVACYNIPATTPSKLPHLLKQRKPCVTFKELTHVGPPSVAWHFFDDVETELRSCELYQPVHARTSYLTPQPRKRKVLNAVVYIPCAWFSRTLATPKRLS